jgi:hypothetical protein
MTQQQTEELTLEEQKRLWPLKYDALAFNKNCEQITLEDVTKVCNRILQLKNIMQDTGEVTYNVVHDDLITKWTVNSNTYEIVASKAEDYISLMEEAISKELGSLSNVTCATIRDGEDCNDIECRFKDGQKFAAIEIDKEITTSDTLSKVVMKIVTMHEYQLKRLLEQLGDTHGQN